MPLKELAIPILQAPIGSCAGAELAGQVSLAGGLGALALTWTPPQRAKSLVQAVRRMTNKPFLVNFVLAFEPHALTAALEAGAPVVGFSWGIPSQHVRLVKSFNASVGVQVSNAEGARRAVDAGADFLIAQGVEAGGHVQATQPLAHVLPDVLRHAGTTPVVAAGGLATGEDIARVLQLGASAAMLGTRFIATTESLAHPTYKKKLVDASASEATLTVCFDRGWPYAAHRVLRNATLENWEAAGCPPSGVRPGESDEVAHIQDRVVRRYEDTPALEGMQGNVLDLCLYAGTGVGKITDIMPAGELLRGLWRDCLVAQNLSGQLSP
jgi:nitronate monooxygenase